MSNFKQREKWFQERVGKTIFRKKTDCDCQNCKNICTVSINIIDSKHASVLHGYENTDMKTIYYDKKSDVPLK